MSQAPNTKLMPNFKWAQDGDHLYVTIELLDVNPSEMKCKITRDDLYFYYKYPSTHKQNGNKEFELSFKFRFGVTPKSAEYSVKREVEFKLEKETSNAWWPHIVPKEDKRLVKNRCHIDWSRWMEEDDEPKQTKFDGQQLSPQMQDMFSGVDNEAGDEEEDMEGDSDDEPINGLDDQIYESNNNVPQLENELLPKVPPQKQLTEEEKDEQELSEMLNKQILSNITGNNESKIPESNVTNTSNVKTPEIVNKSNETTESNENTQTTEITETTETTETTTETPETTKINETVTTEETENMRQID